MRSAAAMAAVTAVFAGTLVGGLSYTGALDPELLRGPDEDGPGARAGWKTHSHPAAGFSIQLPPAWRRVSPTGRVRYQEREGKQVVASLSVERRSARGLKRAPRGMMVKRFVRGDHVLTFSTPVDRAASYTRVFEHAAASFRLLRST
jgi:hypothetical protein